MSQANNIGIVILAAGSSSRLGNPKQLLKYGGKSLLQNAIDAAVSSNASEVVIVLGANAEEISKEIDKSKITTIVNTEWGEGMASSVRSGLNELLLLSPSTDAVILMVCDQPHISSSILNELIIAHQKTTKQIVACNYGDWIGPPALFHKKYFKELMKLSGDTGARKIIQQNMNDMATILFLEGRIDIDTEKDYEELNNS